MARAVLQLRQNPLAYPGRTPGFDPSHVAARGISAGHGFSGITANGGFLNLLNAGPGAMVGSPSAVIGGQTGPSTNFPASSCAKFPINLVSGDTSLTLAAIATFTGSNSFNMLLSTGDAAGLSLQIRDNSGFIGCYNWAVGGDVTTLAPVLNNTYFIAASQNGASTLNFVILNLSTGVLFSQTKTPVGAIGAASGNYVVGAGTTAGGFASLSNIASVMTAPGYLSMPQLLAWASDPWSFWYPRTFDIGRMLVGTAAAGGFIPAWAMNSNRPVIGAGTY